MALPNALVIANCNHWSLSEALRQANLFENVHSIALYSLPTEERKRLFDTIDRFDYILTLSHGSRYGDLSTSNLKKMLGSRLVSVPTPYFSAIYPDICYLQHGQELATCERLLGDYHSAAILNDVKMGYTSEEIAQRYENGESFSLLDLEGIWQDNINEMLTRDSICDIPLSPLINQALGDGSLQDLFLSINHPSERVINYIACSFVRKTLSETFPQQELISSAMHGLYAGAILPVHPIVVSKFGLREPKNIQFKQPDDLGGQRFSLNRFAKLSADYFKSINNLDLVSISSPYYLSSRITTIYKTPIPGSKFGDTFIKNEPEAVQRETSPEKFIIFNFGRSGASVLSQMLGQHSGIISHEDLFSRPQIYESLSRGVSTESLVDMIDNEVYSQDKIKAKHHCIEVRLIHFLANPSSDIPSFFRELQKRGGYKLILLKRENVLRRLLSSYKASKSGVYRKPASSSQEMVDASIAPIYFSIEDFLMDWDTGQRGHSITDLIDKVIQSEHQVYLDMIEAGFDPLILTYEEHIDKDPQKAYSIVLDYLSIAWQPAEVWLKKISTGVFDGLANPETLSGLLQDSPHQWMIDSPLADNQSMSSPWSHFDSSTAPDFQKPIFQLLQKFLPLESLRKCDSMRWAFRDSWSGDDQLDSVGALEALHSLWDSQSVAFMVDLIPYFLDILRDDDGHAYWIHEPMLLLDVGARTGAGSDLLGSMFFGGASRRRAVVDVLDLDPTFADYVRKTKRFIRNYIVEDISRIPAGVYDYVFASHVIEHIPDPIPFCEELKRIAKKKVICYTPFDEINPIHDHHTVNMATLQSIGARRIEVTDKSWHWKHPEKHQHTVMFYLESSC